MDTKHTNPTQKWIVVLLALLIAVVAVQSFWLFKLSGPHRDGIEPKLFGEWLNPTTDPRAFEPPNGYSGWDPFSEMHHMRQQMDHLFGNALNRFEHNPRFGEYFNHRMSLSPRIDFEEEADLYRIKVDLPGVESGEVKVSLDDRMLTIEAETRYQRDETDETGQSTGRILRRERHQGHFVRQLQLPEAVDADGMQQTMKNGVLEIVIPKAHA